MDLAQLANFGLDVPAAADRRRRPWCRSSSYAVAAAVVLALEALAGLRGDALVVAPVSLALFGLVQAARRWDARRRLRAEADAWILRGYENRAASRYGWRIDELTGHGNGGCSAARCAQSSHSCPNGGRSARCRSTASGCVRAAQISSRLRTDSRPWNGPSRRPESSPSTVCSPSPAASSTRRPASTSGRSTPIPAPCSARFSTTWRCVPDVRPRGDRDRNRVLRVRVRHALRAGTDLR